MKRLFFFLFVCILLHSCDSGECNCSDLVQGKDSLYRNYDHHHDNEVKLFQKFRISDSLENQYLKLLAEQDSLSAESEGGLGISVEVKKIEKQLHEVKKTGNKDSLIICYMGLAYWQEISEPREAEENYFRAMQLLEETGTNLLLLSRCYSNLALMKYSENRASGKEYVYKSINLFEKSIQEKKAMDYLTIAYACMQYNLDVQSGNYINQAEERNKVIPDPDVTSQIILFRFYNSKSSSYRKIKIGEYDTFIHQPENMKDQKKLLGRVQTLGNMCAGNADINGKVKALEEALGIAEKLGDLNTCAERCADLVIYYEALGNQEKGQEYKKKANDFYEKITERQQDLQKQMMELEFSIQKNRMAEMKNHEEQLKITTEMRRSSYRGPTRLDDFPVFSGTCKENGAIIVFENGKKIGPKK